MHIGHRPWKRVAWVCLTALVWLGVGHAALAQADLSGSYDGQLVATNGVTASSVAATLSQSGRVLSGTVSLTLSEARLTGTYNVHGKNTGKRFWHLGKSDTGARFSWRGPASAAPLTGRLRLATRPYVHLRGTLTLTPGTGGGGGGTGTGAALYTQNCSACHGADARGVAGRPDIHCNKAIHDTVRNGRTGSIGVMPAFANLSDADIAAIQSFLNSLCTTPQTPAEFFSSSCASCHGSDAAGLGGRPDIRCTVRSRIYNAMRSGRGNGLMPVFTASAVPDTQVDQLADYLGSLCDGTPAGFFRSNCVTCHGATGGGGVNADGIPGPNMRCTATNDFLEKVQLGSNPMPAFPEFTTTDVQAIASFVQVNFCPLGG